MEKILKELIEVIELKQGDDLVVIDVKETFPITDYIFIITANSSVHSTSLANYIIEFFLQKNLGNFFIRKNMNLDNPWILIDGGQILVNIFLKDAREFYNLEKLYFKGNVVFDNNNKVLK
jgi:ribosome-associated protein